MMVDHASIFLVDVAMVWVRIIYADVEKGLNTIAMWNDFKRELKKQFYIENATYETKARLRRLTQ